MQEQGQEEEILLPQGEEGGLGHVLLGGESQCDLQIENKTASLREQG